MDRTRIALLVVALTASGGCAAVPPPTETASGPPIHIEDVARFYALYEASAGHPSESALQHDYLDTGSDGLRRFATIRNITGAAMAKSIATRPAVYADAKRCMAALPAVRRRLTLALDKLQTLYPRSAERPVTVAVGRGKPVGATDATGVMIGLEALCAITYFEPDVEDRFVHVLAHEYAHVQQAVQAPALYDAPRPTVLEASLIEGAAEFVGELISGSVAHVDLQASIRGREREIETQFVADQDQTDLSRWLYNGTLTQSGDLGYGVGYRIVKAYYVHAPNKRQALRDILEMNDAKAFLAGSGWHPGIVLPAMPEDPVR